MSLRAALAREHIRRTSSVDSSSSRSFSRETESSVLRQRPNARHGAAPPPRVGSSRGVQEPWSLRRERSTSPGKVAPAMSSRSSSDFRPRQASPLPAQGGSSEPCCRKAPTVAKGRNRGESRSPSRPPWRAASSQSASSGASLGRSSSAQSLRHDVKAGASLQRSSSAQALRREVPRNLAPASSQEREESRRAARFSSTRRESAGAEAASVRVSRNDLADEVARLRLALDITTKRIEETLAEVSATQLSLKDKKVCQELEVVQIKEVLDMLTSENKRLQAGARNGWSSAWKLQAALRSHEEEVEMQSEELLDRQRRLEQENSRLRKEAAAVKTRLLAWRQMQKRSASYDRKVPCAMTKPSSGGSAARGNLPSCECVAMEDFLEPATSSGHHAEASHPTVASVSIGDVFLFVKETAYEYKTQCIDHELVTVIDKPLPGGLDVHVRWQSGFTHWVFLADLRHQAQVDMEDVQKNSQQSTLRAATQKRTSDCALTTMIGTKTGSEAINTASPSAFDEAKLVDERSIFNEDVPLQAPRGEPPGAYRQLADDFRNALTEQILKERSEVVCLTPQPEAQTMTTTATGDREQSSESTTLSQSQDLTAALSPAAREAADVSAMVRTRAAEALRGLGLRGELRSSRSCSGRSSPRSDSSTCR